MAEVFPPNSAPQITPQNFRGHFTEFEFATRSHLAKLL